MSLNKRAVRNRGRPTSGEERISKSLQESQALTLTKANVSVNRADSAHTGEPGKPHIHTNRGGKSPYHMRNPFGEEVKDMNSNPATRSKDASSPTFHEEIHDFIQTIGSNGTSNLANGTTGSTRNSTGNNIKTHLDIEGVDNLIKPDTSMEKTGLEYRIDLLTNAYKKSKKKSLTMENKGKESAIPLKVQTQQAARVYAAMATLLYASMSIAKAESLEEFIRKKGSNLPTSLFDFNQWNQMMAIARDVRYHSQLSKFASTDQLNGTQLNDMLNTTINRAQSLQRPYTTEGNGRGMGATYPAPQGVSGNNRGFDGNATMTMGMNMQGGRPFESVNNNWTLNTTSVIETESSLRGRAPYMSRMDNVLHQFNGGVNTVKEGIRQDLSSFNDVLASIKDTLIPYLQTYERKCKDALDAKDMTIETLKIQNQNSGTDQLAAVHSMDHRNLLKNVTLVDSTATIDPVKLMESGKKESSAPAVSSAEVKKLEGQIKELTDKLTAEQNVNRTLKEQVSGLTLEISALKKEAGGDLDAAHKENVSMKHDHTKLQLEMAILHDKLAKTKDMDKGAADEDDNMVKNHPEMVKLRKAFDIVNDEHQTLQLHHQNLKHSHSKNSIELEDMRKKLSQHQAEENINREKIFELNLKLKEIESQLTAELREVEFWKNKAHEDANSPSDPHHRVDLNYQSHAVIPPYVNMATRHFDITDGGDAQRMYHHKNMGNFSAFVVPGSDYSNANMIAANHILSNALGHGTKNATIAHLSKKHSSEKNALVSAHQNEQEKHQLKIQTLEQELIALQERIGGNGVGVTEMLKGERVECNFEGKGSWYDGTIADVIRSGEATTYAVQYDDGDFEDRVPAPRIRLPGTATDGRNNNEVESLKQELALTESKLNLSELEVKAKCSDIESFTKEAKREFDKLNSEIARMQKEHKVIDDHRATLREEVKHLKESIEQSARPSSPQNQAAHAASGAIMTAGILSASGKLLSSTATPALHTTHPPHMITTHAVKEIVKEVEVVKEVTVEIIKPDPDTEKQLKQCETEVSSLLEQIKQLKETIEMHSKMADSSADEEKRLLNEALSTKTSALALKEVEVKEKDKDIKELQFKVHALNKEMENLKQLKEGADEQALKQSMKLHDTEKSLEEAYGAKSKLEVQVRDQRSIIAQLQNDVDDLHAQGSSVDTPTNSGRNRKKTTMYVSPEQAQKEEEEESINEKKAAVNTSPLINNTRGKPVIANREKAVVDIQRIVRGFQARIYVEDLLMAKAARHQGVLVAYKPSGTVQGESGWYINNDSLFYFATVDGQFKLLCGPTTAEEYDTILNECINLTEMPTSEVSIDRMGLLAVRKEIERQNDIIKDLKYDNGPEGKIGMTIERLTAQVNSLMQDLNECESIIKGKDAEIKSNLDRIKEHKVKERDLRREIQDLNQKAIAMRDVLTAIKTEKAEVHENLDQVVLHTPVKASNDDSTGTAMNYDYMSREPNSVSKLRKVIMHEDPANLIKVIKIQALVRGYNSRVKVRQIRAFNLATNAKVLVALRGTVQGRLMICSSSLLLHLPSIHILITYSSYYTLSLL